jgi:anti-anti-sigma factor
MSSKYQSHWLERQEKGEVTVVRLKTPKLLDDDTVRAVFDPIYALVGEVGRSKLVLGLAAVEQLTSLVLAKLVMLSRKAQTGNGRLVLCQLHPTVQEALEVTRLTDLFGIYATEEEAVQSFS